MRNSFLNPNGQDASNYIEDILNSPFGQIPTGFYLVARPIKLSVIKQINGTGVILYTVKDHEVLRIEQEKFNIDNLTINTSLVSNGNPKNALVRIAYKKIVTQYSRLNNITLIGEIFKRRNNGRANGVYEFGHTGLACDAISNTSELATTNTPGEMHWCSFDLNLFQLYNGIYFPKQAPLSRNNFNIVAQRVKQLGDISGNGNQIRYQYNSSHTLLEHQKDFDLLALRGDNNKLLTGFVDAGKWKEVRKKNGVKQYAHRYKATIYGKNNTTFDTKYDWGDFNEIKNIHKPFIT